MWDRIKHSATVAALTWLIWWSADRRVTDRAEIPVRLEVKSADQSFIATIENPQPPEVSVTLTGTRGRLDASARRYRRQAARYRLPRSTSTAPVAMMKAGSSPYV